MILPLESLTGVVLQEQQTFVRREYDDPYETVPTVKLDEGEDIVGFVSCGSSEHVQ